MYKQKLEMKMANLIPCINHEYFVDFGKSLNWKWKISDQWWNVYTKAWNENGKPHSRQESWILLKV